MKSSKLAALLAFAMTAGLVSPVLAADDGLDKAVQGSLMVTRIGGVGTGLVLGIPVAGVRETVKTYHDITDKASDKVGGKVGGKESGPVVGLVSLVTLPVAIVLGSAKGVYYGGRNAVVDGFDAPFAPESYSITDKYEE